MAPVRDADEVFLGGSIVHDVDERVDAARVELGAAVRLELDDRLVDGHSLAVGARSGHRLEGVGDGDDPRLDGDRRTTETGRVAATVDALVMVENPMRLDRKLGREQDRVPDLDMLGHRRHLVGRKRVGLLKDGVRDADLPHVVEQARETHPLETGRLDLETLADRDTELGNRLGVAPGSGVLRVDGAGERGGKRTLLV